MQAWKQKGAWCLLRISKQCTMAAQMFVSHWQWDPTDLFGILDSSGSGEGHVWVGTWEGKGRRLKSGWPTKGLFIGGGNSKAVMGSRETS